MIKISMKVAQQKDFEKQQWKMMNSRNSRLYRQPEEWEPVMEMKKKWSERQKENQIAVLESEGEENAERLKVVQNRG